MSQPEITKITKTPYFGSSRSFLRSSLPVLVMISRMSVPVLQPFSH